MTEEQIAKLMELVDAWAVCREGEGRVDDVFDAYRAIETFARSIAGGEATEARCRQITSATGEGMSAYLIGRRAQACDCGKCEPITIMTEPQRAADGSWQVLVIFDDRPGYITPLGVNYLWLKNPDAQKKENGA